MVGSHFPVPGAEAPRSSADPNLGLTVAAAGVTELFGGISAYLGAANRARALRIQAKTNADAIRAQAQLDANAIKFQADFEQRQSDFRKELLQEDRRITRKAFDEKIAEERRNIKRLTAAQRVAFAVQGIDAGSESILDVIEGDRFTGEIDVMRLQNNAARQVLGMKLQERQIGLARDVTGINARAQAALAKIGGRSRASVIKSAAKLESRATLLTGGLRLGRSAFRAADIVFGSPKQNERRERGRF